MKQFKAGYIIDSISSILDFKKSKLDKKKQIELVELDKINGLLQHLSSFDVQFPKEFELDYKNLNPILATVNNIITRGLPTKSPIFIEDKFVEIGLIKPNEKEFEFDYQKSNTEITYETIFELLHIIKPELNICFENYAGKPEGGEWDFLNKTLSKYPFAKQILQSQRDFSTISPTMIGGKRVDFSFEYPYLVNEKSTDKILRKKGVILEFDGGKYHAGITQFYDKYRDDSADKENFDTLRQSSDEKGLTINIENLFESAVFKIYAKNYKRNITDYLTEYTLLFVPLAVARIQKSIIEYLLANVFLLEQSTITIAIIERDFPCGALAIKGLEDIFFNLNSILDSKLQLPKFELSIFESLEYVIDNRLHLGIQPKTESHFNESTFNIIIDHSILTRSNIYIENHYQNENSIIVRSSHYFDSTYGNARRVYCADLLKYKELVKRQGDGSYKPIPELKPCINFFIQNIFRKKGYREGQLPIISRALRQKPVIGLLPTGGGKSLTYQLPVLMQPGICLIVDPIKSLMEDQTRVLNKNRIDNCNYINSNLERQEKHKRLIDFRYGETQFLFVSPERFVMDDFRTIIQNLDLGHFGISFSYCVIDEVHCVSEWGHDFRSTYLMLGKNSQTFSKTKSSEPVSLIGLTATASFDVLADIERELQIQSDDVANAIIMIENTIRPELFFRVIDVTGKDRMSELNNDFKNAGKNLAKINTNELISKSLKHHFTEFEIIDKDNKNYYEIFDDKNEFQYRYVNSFILKEKDVKKGIESDESAILNTKTQNDFYSIIFCPVRGQAGHELGVDKVFENLHSASRGYFYSVDEEKKVDKVKQKEIQEFFERFVNDDLMHIVCTKAFGMGIDKSDIRSTYHFLYSSSLESLVQEAGRSGRDKKISEANILISSEKYYYFDIFTFFTMNFEDGLIRRGRVRQSIRKTLQLKFEDGKPKEIIFSSIDELIKTIDKLDLSFVALNGNEDFEKTDKLRNLMKSKDKQESYLYIHENYLDRRIHDFFYKNSFKGIDIEKSQFQNLFYDKEFETTVDGIVYIPGQDCLTKELNSCDNQVDFYITATKKYIFSDIEICNLLGIFPNDPAPFGDKTRAERVNDCLKFSRSFDDFLFLLEEYGLKNLTLIDNITREKLTYFYCRNREEKNDTGRLIYRMHCMGLLYDYIIDFNNNNLYKCTFTKRAIDDYVLEIESYLRRYLSEQSALMEIAKLKERLTKNNLIDNILECLYFLSEFSYNEIAKKRKSATNEIEKVLNYCITEYNENENWFEQNLYLKEQIYFYFNAKYARLEFNLLNEKGELEPHSLFVDYKYNREEKDGYLPKSTILDKYLKALKREGTEQNNYKHMIGSCKKILSSLPETDLKKEWLLRILKAFALYSVNNVSYIKEANNEVETGFYNLYEDFKDKNDNIEPIFDMYFERLIDNIEKSNVSYNIVKQIRLKILQTLQEKAINDFVRDFNKLNFSTNG